MSISNTSICNEALARIAARRINSLDDATDSKPEAIQCRLHFERTRNSLQRSHFWVFNKDRATLSESTPTPDFEYSKQYILPSDFLRFRRKFDEGADFNTISVFSFSIETNSSGEKVLLTDEDSVRLIYSKLVTDPTKFDELYTDVLVLKLARKLSVPLSGDDKMTALIDEDLRPLMATVRALDRNEGMGTRQNEQWWWNDARIRFGGRRGPTVANS